MKLSIVTSLYYSEPYLREFCRMAGEAAAAVVDGDYEIVLVNDGSPDASADLARQLADESRHIRLIELSRNFGHHYALFAGLEASRGEKIFLIDCDLEESPALLVDFWREMKADPTVDVIYGVQQGQRKGKAFERLSGQLFYDLFDRIVQIPYAANQLTARLMTRDYVRAVLSYSETQMDLWGIFALAGFRQKVFAARKGSKGKSTYTLKRKIKLAMEMITSFSDRPLLMILALGMAITGVSGVFIFWFMGQYIFDKQPLSGWTSLMVSLWFLGGLILFSIGIVALYLSKVFLEVKRRPRYHIRTSYER